MEMDFNPKGEGNTAERKKFSRAFGGRRSWLITPGVPR